MDRQTSRAGVRVGRLRDTVRRHPCLADGLLAVVLAILTTADVVRHGSESPLAIAFHLALWVPIAFRRRAPELVFGGIAAIAFVQWMVSVPVAGDAALLVALYTVAAHRRLDRALAAAVVLEFGVLLAVLRWATGPSNLRLLILLTGMVLAALLLGVTQRSRRAYLAQLVGRAERLERERDQQAQLATAAERTRIAREMHDIVAHSLSVMITLATVPLSPTGPIRPAPRCTTSPGPGGTRWPTLAACSVCCGPTRQQNASRSPAWTGSTRCSPPSGRPAWRSTWSPPAGTCRQRPRPRPRSIASCRRR